VQAAQTASEVISSWAFATACPVPPAEPVKTWDFLGGSSMHPVRVGTCGWSYKEWSGPFYPEDLAPSDYLEYLATRYPVVEVDSTFYRSPARRTVEGWRDRTPPGFGFSLKVPQVITHEKVLLDCQDDMSRFLTAVRVLGEKLLCCTLQFGYFNKGKFASLAAFLDRLEPFLASWPRDVQLAVEVRNKAWMTAALGDCLRRHNVVWVLPDQAWMPSPPTASRTAGSKARLRLSDEFPPAQPGNRPTAPAGVATAPAFGYNGR
jgi:uncharacterized protein YecE (DUF72 family)